MLAHYIESLRVKPVSATVERFPLTDTDGNEYLLKVTVQIEPHRFRLQNTAEMDVFTTVWGEILIRDVAKQGFELLRKNPPSQLEMANMIALGITTENRRHWVLVTEIELKLKTE